MKNIGIYESHLDDKESISNNYDIKSYYNLKNNNYIFYCDNVSNRKNLNRPQLNQLKDDIINHKISNLIIKDTGQICRDTHRVVAFYEFAKKYGCELKTLNNFDFEFAIKINKILNQKQKEL